MTSESDVGSPVGKDDQLRQDELLELLDGEDLTARLHGVRPLQSHVPDRIVGLHPQPVDQVAGHDDAGPAQA